MRKDNVLSQTNGVVTYWGGSTPIWFSIDLGPNRRLCCNYFSLRHGYNAANSYPLNIQFDASNDNKTWLTLNKQVGSIFTKAYDTHSFGVRNSSFYRYFRVLQPGNYGMGTSGGAGSPYFCVSGFEVYGTLTYRTGDSKLDIDSLESMLLDLTAEATTDKSDSHDEEKEDEADDATSSDSDISWGE